MAAHGPEAFGLGIEEVDIFDYPDVITPIPQDCSDTIGDLHSSAVKLLHYLVRRGVIQINRENYDELVYIFTMEEAGQQLSGEDLELFDTILDEININPKTGMFRLIGDELCDRATNDFFILKLLDKLNNAHAPYEVIFSNHSAFFYQYYFHALTQAPFRFDKKGAFASEGLKDLINDDSFASTPRLMTLAERFDLYEEIDDIVRTAHLPHLKLISYSLFEHGIMLFNHAPTNLNRIKGAAEELEVEYDDETKEALAQTIDRINAAFKKRFSFEYIELLNENPIASHVARLFNDRTFGDEDNEEDKPTPAMHNGYGVAFVTGHEGPSGKAAHYLEIDTPLGKFTDKQVKEYIKQIRATQAGLPKDALEYVVANYRSKIASKELRTVKVRQSPSPNMLLERDEEELPAPDTKKRKREEEAGKPKKRGRPKR